MMRKHFFTLTILFLTLLSCKGEQNKKITESKKEEIIVSETKITPVSHATAVIEFDKTTIYLDPTGTTDAFSNFKKADYLLITDIHGDHLNLKTLNSLDLTSTTIIAPEAVAQKISELKVKEVITINNGETKNFDNFKVEAIPMYNLRKEALKFHSKGRGNGYVLTIADERIYFSGDTEDIPEMRNLKNINKAFVCMNLPYTMNVESAADAVLAFKPTKVYPYHYRGTDGLSDVVKFKKIVNEKNKNIEVIQLNWYPKKK
ncbi:MBL fold metallo-hydrolase [Polaribacter vadi]|uniref:MBL fold metallo-hydrolase n=1 Tax=Polaribacter vadi TaxID=1774273 RepID=UPI003F5401A1